ncbi:MAG: hypothetical protein V7K27_29830 [Nostoc sp.]|uniref:hypothetical protein n=1 Tax=Nostoc sp. TaxID=1180 RepID=UPI002FFC9B77
MNSEQNDALSESIEIYVKESGLIENTNYISKAIPNQPWVQKIIGASGVTSRKDAGVREIKREIEKSIFIPKSRRPSGIWKGKVSMPDNFNDLSSDIVSDFGMEK